MEKNFRTLSTNNGISRRTFLSYGVASAGLLLLGTANASALPERLTDLRSKFRQMEGYGIPPFVSWSDPTMKALLSALTLINNSSVRSGGSEPLPISGASHEEQFRSLNSILGKAPLSPFGPDSLNALEKL